MFRCEFYWPFLTRGAPRKKNSTPSVSCGPHNRYLRDSDAKNEKWPSNENQMFEFTCSFISFYFILVSFSVGRKIAVNIILQTANTDRSVWMNLFVYKMRPETNWDLVVLASKPYIIWILRLFLKMKWVWKNRIHTLTHTHKCWETKIRVKMDGWEKSDCRRNKNIYAHS